MQNPLLEYGHGLMTKDHDMPGYSVKEPHQSLCLGWHGLSKAQGSCVLQFRLDMMRHSTFSGAMHPWRLCVCHSLLSSFEVAGDDGAEAAGGGAARLRACTLSKLLSFWHRP